MHGIPGRRFGGHEVGAFVERSDFVLALIVGSGGAKSRDLADSRKAVLAVHHDLGLPDGFSKFVQNFAGEHGVGGEPQSEVLGIDAGHSGHDRARKLIVLIVGSGDESTPGALQGKFSRRDVKFKMAGFRTDHELDVLAHLGVHDGDACARHRRSGIRVHDNSGDPPGASGDLASLRVLGIRAQDRAEQGAEYERGMYSLSLIHI